MVGFYAFFLACLVRNCWADSRRKRKEDQAAQAQAKARMRPRVNSLVLSRTDSSDSIMSQASTGTTSPTGNFSRPPSVDTEAYSAAMNASPLMAASPLYGASPMAASPLYGQVVHGRRPSRESALETYLEDQTASLQRRRNSACSVASSSSTENVPQRLARRGSMGNMSSMGSSFGMSGVAGGRGAYAPSSPIAQSPSFGRTTSPAGAPPSPVGVLRRTSSSSRYFAEMVKRTAQDSPP